MAGIDTMQLLEGYLKVNTDRQQMIASNMANIDTPGYHTKDMNFQAAMQQVANASSTGQFGAVSFEPASMEVAGLPERPDGNNVNIDRESMLLSQTQLQYQMGVQLIKSQFHTLLTAIKEGS
jgi:flagellar basal-body rod protein FlgB